MRQAGYRMRAMLILMGVLAIGACSRNKFPVTECIDGKPAVERVNDVAPPNCGLEGSM